MNKTENLFRLLTTIIKLHTHIADLQIVVLFVDSLQMPWYIVQYFLGIVCVIREAAYAGSEDCRSLHIEKHFGVSFWF